MAERDLQPSQNITCVAAASPVIKKGKKDVRFYSGSDQAD